MVAEFADTSGYGLTIGQNSASAQAYLYMTLVILKTTFRICN